MADKYPILLAVKERFAAGKDYRICSRDRGSWATIVAPHGGYIEAGTSAIARSIAGKTYNHFDFQALRPESARDLHVTATRFRDPVLSRLLESSLTAVSVHGMGTCSSEVLWLGGLNVELKELALVTLKERGIAVVSDSPKYRGESPANIVNLPRLKGVQLELSDELIATLFAGKKQFSPRGRCPKTTERFAGLVEAIQQTLRQFERTLELPHKMAADASAG